ncbi:uncharacterized protein LOC141856315 [Brevipalpus obovatus]|uniref:uncharacterized protein LOC141856315 n=1 Tax=Brevipalpus obovatus TaxID=246614 RepID=UPI003D9F9067
MKVACIFVVFVVFMATSEARVVEIKDFPKWQERLIKLADKLEKKLKKENPNTESFDSLRKQFHELNDENFGIVHEFTLLELGRSVGEQIQCRFNNNNFNCLKL